MTAPVNTSKPVSQTTAGKGRRDGGSGGRMFDLRERQDGAWDVVLLLDGGYSSRRDAEASLMVEVDNFRRAYVAEAEAGHLEPASDQHLAQIGLEERSPEP